MKNIYITAIILLMFERLFFLIFINKISFGKYIISVMLTLI